LRASDALNAISLPYRQDTKKGLIESG
jgi:hypothetical protein